MTQPRPRYQGKIPAAKLAPMFAAIDDGQVIKDVARMYHLEYNTLQYYNAKRKGVSNGFSSRDASRVVKVKAEVERIRADLGRNTIYRCEQCGQFITNRESSVCGSGGGELHSNEAGETWRDGRIHQRDCKGKR